MLEFYEVLEMYLANIVFKIIKYFKNLFISLKKYKWWSMFSLFSKQIFAKKEKQISNCKNLTYLCFIYIANSRYILKNAFPSFRLHFMVDFIIESLF